MITSQTAKSVMNRPVPERPAKRSKPSNASPRPSLIAAAFFQRMIVENNHVNGTGVFKQPGLRSAQVSCSAACQESWLGMISAAMPCGELLKSHGGAMLKGCHDEAGSDRFPEGTSDGSDQGTSQAPGVAARCGHRLVRVAQSLKAFSPSLRASVRPGDVVPVIGVVGQGRMTSVVHRRRWTFIVRAVVKVIQCRRSPSSLSSSFSPIRGNSVVVFDEGLTRRRWSTHRFGTESMPSFRARVK